MRVFSAGGRQIVRVRLHGRQTGILKRLERRTEKLIGRERRVIAVDEITRN